MKLDAASSSFLGEVTWEPATCSQWCSKSGMCPTSGSAQDDSCLARPTDAVGEVTDSRCVRWCDSNAKLTVTVSKNLPGNTTVGISVTMLNPTFSQTASPLIVSASGSGFYIHPHQIEPISGSAGVLSARSAPAFSEFTITEDPCDGELDASTNKWRGSCAGMINTLVFSMKSNLELYAGARIIISGLVRSGAATNPPLIRDSPGTLNALSIEKWEASTGTVTLRVLEGGGAPDSVVVPVGSISKFALVFEMPSIADDISLNSKVITVDVLRAGLRLSCDFVQHVMSNVDVLTAKNTTESSCETRIVGASTCYPGEFFSYILVAGCWCIFFLFYVTSCPRIFIIFCGLRMSRVLRPYAARKPTEKNVGVCVAYACRTNVSDSVRCVCVETDPTSCYLFHTTYL